MVSETAATEVLGFAEFATIDPAATAVIDVDGSAVTRGEVGIRANRLSNALLDCGIELDDRVALLTENSVEYFVWAIACGQIGAHLVPLNVHAAAAELAYILTNSSAKVGAVSPLCADLGTLALDAAGFTGLRVSWDSTPGYTTVDDLVASCAAAAPCPRTHGSIMLYTAGTTGRPKGVLFHATPGVTPEMAVRASRAMFERRGMSTDGVSLVCGPLYHGAPGAHGLQALNWGQTVVLMDRWDSTRMLELVERHRVTHVQMAPIHFHRLLQLSADVSGRYDVSSLRAVTHAGSGCPVDVKQAMMDWFGPVLYEYYAASEGFATSIGPTDWLAHRGSVGHMSSDRAEIAILGDDGRSLARNDVGVVYVRTPGMPESEYLGDPDMTRASRRPGGFHTFGDMGYLDDDGWLFLVDRRSDLILSGAVNIYPAEVERVLVQHPKVDDAAVIGVPDVEWGQRVHAFVVPAAGVAADDRLVAELSDHCAGLLAKFKCPRVIEFRDDLPYSAAGKLVRRTLRDIHWPSTTHRATDGK